MVRIYAVVLALVLAKTAVASTQIQIKGSDTEVNLVQMLAEKFMATNKGVSISVTGGGSGAGIAALANKTADLANSSRPLKPEEEALIKKGGKEPQSVIFATDALSVIVNSKNPLKKLTVEQIGKIFRGEITNWKDVGGEDKTISLYGRQSNSGTFVFFRDVVLKGDYSSSLKSMNGTAQIVEGVKADAAAIGYVGVGYVIDQKTSKPVEGITLLTVGDGAKFFNPLNEKEVLSGQYPIARPLYQYFVGTPSKELLDFLKFELSPAGRSLVKKEGFYDLTKEYAEFNKKVLK